MLLNIICINKNLCNSFSSASEKTNDYDAEVIYRDLLAMYKSHETLLDILTKAI